jgi:hypothetical protein
LVRALDELANLWHLSRLPRHLDLDERMTLTSLANDWLDKRAFCHVRSLCKEAFGRAATAEARDLHEERPRSVRLSQGC